jgi:aldehyde:ferredoxin oxidoreductase
MTMRGYGGRILFVDVGSGGARIEPVSDQQARSLLGGNGFAARLLLDHVPPGIDPYDPANAVIFAVGPVTDTTVPGNSRACVAGKSPLTGLFLDSTFGGRFPATMKRTGFDAIVITGCAAEPVYVKVTEEGARIHPARTLWGKTTRDTVQTLHLVEGADADVMAIGPAGERLVRFAAMGTYWRNREAFAGRGGLASVLGSKRVKALVVAGVRKTEVADPAGLKVLLEQQREPLKTGTQALSTYGTPFLVKPINALGALGSYNLRREVFADAVAISGEEMHAHFHDRDTTCLKCSVACGKQYEVREGELAALKAKMPEYETIFAFGSMLGNAHAGSLVRANDLCDLLGLDTISMGVTLAFVCEAIERGWLSERDVGLPFGWGDWRGMLRLVEQTALREGFGDRLAEGAWRLAESVHPEATRLVYAVKRLELPAHSARALKGMSIGYATATRGGSHHDTRPTPQYAQNFDRRSPEGKPEFAIRSQHFTAVGDSLVLCRFTSERGFGLYVDEPYARMISAITGWDMSADEVERVGERVINLERLFNVREGVRRRDDALPWRVMHEPIPEGPSAGAYCPPEELGRMLDRYYALRGWDADGAPTPARLAALGL